MKMKSLRQALLMAAVVAGTAAFLTSPALAQPAPGPPVCGGVASLMNHQIFIKNASGNKGENIVSIPSVSPINNNPTSATTNGFIDLCKRFGLNGTTSQVKQFQAQTGSVVAFDCSSTSAPTFTPGQAVLIEPTVSATGRIPGVECARPYTAYIQAGAFPRGYNLWPAPVTFAGGLLPSGAADVCTQLGLPSGSIVTRIDANLGNPQDQPCPGAGAYSTKIGEGLLIRPTSTVTGTPTIF
jgi:hypothetical protein